MSCIGLQLNLKKSICYLQVWKLGHTNSGAGAEAWKMATPPTGGGVHMADIWPSGSGLVCLSRPTVPSGLPWWPRLSSGGSIPGSYSEGFLSPSRSGQPESAYTIMCLSWMALFGRISSSETSCLKCRGWYITPGQRSGNFGSGQLTDSGLLTEVVEIQQLVKRVP